MDQSSAGLRVCLRRAATGLHVAEHRQHDNRLLGRPDAMPLEVRAINVPTEHWRRPESCRCLRRVRPGLALRQGVPDAVL